MNTDEKKDALMHQIKILDEKNTETITNLVGIHYAEAELDRALPFIEKDYYDVRKKQLKKERSKILRENNIYEKND